MRIPLLFVSCLLVFSCSSSKEKRIADELKSIIPCESIEISRTVSGDFEYLYFNIYGSNPEEETTYASKIQLHLIDKVPGFCDMDEKIAVQFVVETGTKTVYHPYVYHHCKWLFEF